MDNQDLNRLREQLERSQKFQDAWDAMTGDVRKQLDAWDAMTGDVRKRQDAWDAMTGDVRKRQDAWDAMTGDVRKQLDAWEALTQDAQKRQKIYDFSKWDFIVQKRDSQKRDSQKRDSQKRDSQKRDSQKRDSQKRQAPKFSKIVRPELKNVRNIYPPKFGKKFLYFFLPKELREVVPGDLVEQYATQLEKLGKFWAKAWYYKEVASTIWPYIRKQVIGLAGLFGLGKVVDWWNKMG